MLTARQPEPDPTQPADVLRSHHSIPGSENHAVLDNTTRSLCASSSGSCSSSVGRPRRRRGTASEGARPAVQCRIGRELVGPRPLPSPTSSIVLRLQGNGRGPQPAYRRTFAPLPWKTAIADNCPLVRNLGLGFGIWDYGQITEDRRAHLEIGEEALSLRFTFVLLFPEGHQ